MMLILNYSVLVCFSCLLVIIHGYVADLCYASTGQNMKCSCAKTEPGIMCPANYYCPEYSTQSAQDSHDILTNPPNYCTVDMTQEPPYIKCPCPAGFFCPTNSSQPTYCCKGYYCPSTGNISEEIQDAPGTGLGTWGSLAYECPEGGYCQTAQVKPFDCPNLGKCPKGSNEADRNGQWAILIVAIILIFMAFWVLEYRRERVRKLQKLMFRKEHEHITPNNGSSNPNNNNNSSNNNTKTPLSAPISGNAVMSDNPAAPKEFLIEFEDIGLTLKNGTTIMEGVNGAFKPGRLCAIMGPSGAGKTTIISLVTGKAQKTAGKVFVNKELQDGLMQYRKLVGFVPQEDVMIRSLTVRENINFSARYRLPANLSSFEITQKVNDCIDVLGVSHVQHSVIGDERTRGVSGGQRKRVNIGIELVADPSVLFLDEPTSGLDSTTATSLCATLKKVAQDRKMTIAAVIHQPSISSFHEFDDLLLLGKGGRVVYYGTIAEAPNYFDQLGFPLPVNSNPADFYLDLCQGAVPRRNDPTFEWSHLFEMWENHITPNGSNGSKGSGREASRQSLSVTAKHNNNIFHLELFEKWSWPVLQAGKQLMYDVEDYFHSLYNNIVEGWRTLGKPDPIRQTPGALIQFWLCLNRAGRQVFTTPYELIAEFMVHLFVGIIISQIAKKLIYIGPQPAPICLVAAISQVPDCQLPFADNYTQSANFMCFGVLFVSIASASATFGSEQVNYWRECAAGLQSTPYFLGKIIANFPKIVGAAAFFFISFRIQFQDTGDANELFSLILALYWFGFSLGYVVSQVVAPQWSSMVGVLVALIFAVALAGVQPALTDVQQRPLGHQIPWYLSGPRWVLEAFYVNQVSYYQTIPSGTAFAGASYLNIYPGLEAKGYNINAFSTDIRAIYLCGFGWSVLALYLMLVSYAEKKK